MKQFLTPYHILGVLACAILSFAWPGGAAVSGQQGYTGAPLPDGGTESTCGLCHRGNDDYGAATVTTVITDPETGEIVTAYQPGRTYTISVAIGSEMGSPAGYGFQLAAVDDVSLNIVGTLQNPGAGAGITTVPDGRIYAEHRGISDDGLFTVDWVAPADGVGSVSFYTVGNAVNGNGATSGDSGSQFPDTVMLVNASLPLDLLSFTGGAEKGRGELTWKTANEEAFSHYEIERSQTGHTFSPVGEVTGGRGTYVWTDSDLAPGNYNYRLKMVDLDGSYAYSHLVNLTINSNALTPYPNPATDIVNVGPGEEDDRTVIRSLTGNIVTAQTGAGPLDVSGLSAGIYLIERRRGGELQVAKFIKR